MKEEHFHGPCCGAVWEHQPQGSCVRYKARV